MRRGGTNNISCEQKYPQQTWVLPASQNQQLRGQECENDDSSKAETCMPPFGLRKKQERPRYLSSPPKPRCLWQMKACWVYYCLLKNLPYCKHVALSTFSQLAKEMLHVQVVTIALKNSYGYYKLDHYQTNELISSKCLNPRHPQGTEFENGNYYLLRLWAQFLP